MNARQLGLSILCLSLLWPAANAVSEFEQWKRQQQQSFQQYKDERDREFTEFLKEHWRAIELQQGVARDQTPKPVAIPVAKPKPPEPEPDDEPSVVITMPEPPVITPGPREPLVPAPVLPQQQQGLPIRVDYFGTRLNFYYDPAFKRAVLRPLNEAALSHYWSELSKVGYEPLLEQIDNQAESLQMNDWGYAVLTHRIAQQIYPESKNKQALFTWFMMTKAGYNSRIAYDKRRVYLLLPSEQQMFYVTFFRFDKERYYAISFDGKSIKPGKVFTYDGHYPGAVKKLDMNIRRRAPIAENPEKRDLSFNYRGKHYPIEARYDSSRIAYLNTYPQLELKSYFISEVGQVADSPLLQQLAAAVDGMTELEAVNFLLKFVQHAFEYRTDQQQFGEENFLFPEETLYYPYSDCEDRSVLFAWLVTELLGLEVVGLNYPGHVAAAVHLRQPVAGNFVVFNGKKFTVTDPTYVNAAAGMVMPGYEDMKPGVIPVR